MGVAQALALEDNEVHSNAYRFNIGVRSRRRARALCAAAWNIWRTAALACVVSDLSDDVRDVRAALEQQSHALTFAESRIDERESQLLDTRSALRDSKRELVKATLEIQGLEADVAGASGAGAASAGAACFQPLAGGKFAAASAAGGGGEQESKGGDSSSVA